MKCEHCGDPECAWYASGVAPPTNNPERVYSFLKDNVGQRFCDDCIEKRTKVDRHEVNTIASTLALFPKEFDRAQTQCRCSGRMKLTTIAK